MNLWPNFYCLGRKQQKNYVYGSLYMYLKKMLMLDRLDLKIEGAREPKISTAHVFFKKNVILIWVNIGKKEDGNDIAVAAEDKDWGWRGVLDKNFQRAAKQRIF